MSEPLPNGPFRGLAPFGEGELDALLFFGRETDTRIAVANALGARLTVLYGPSGVGKSSLLRAGVVRSIADLAGTAPVAAAICSSWSGDDVVGEIDTAARRAVASALGGDPGNADGTLGERLDAWTAALGGDLCLVLDQFEEVFTNGKAAEVSPLLAELLGRPRLRVNLLLAVRDDALAELDAFKALLPGLYSNLLRLDHLSRDAARAAIVGPLRRWNERQPDAVATTIDDDLVEAVLDQVAIDGDRVDTSYLQLVMQRIWVVEREEGSTHLRHATLARLGGARRIVADHLRLALEDLSQTEQDLAAGMFAQLVTPSGRKIAHRVVDLAELHDVETATARGILGKLALQRIVRPVGEDDEHGAGRYEIYHDVLCEPVAEWRNARESERARLEEKALARRRHRRLTIVAALALAAAAVLCALTVYAFAERSNARHDARTARSREAAATALTEISVDPVSALVLAVHAAELAPGARVDEALRETLLANKLRRTARLRPAAYALVRSGNDVVAASTGRLTVLDGGLHVKRTLAVDGRVVGTSGDDVLLLHPKTLQVVSPVTGARTTIPLRAGAIVPMLNVMTGRVLREVHVPSTIRYVALGPKRTLLAESDGSRQTVVINVRTGNARYVLTQPSRVTALAFGPGRRTIATGGADGTTHLWRVATGGPRGVLHGRGRVNAIAFSPRATLIATGGGDGIARVWRVAGATSVNQLPGHANPIVDLVFGADGETVATASTDGTVRVWKAETGETLEILQTPSTVVSRIVFTRNGDRIAGIGDDGLVRMWDARAQQPLAPYRDVGAPIERAVWSHTALVVVTDDGVRHSVPVAAAPVSQPKRLAPRGRIVAYRNASGRRVVLRGHTGAVTSARYSPDRTRIVTASRDGTARIWDAATGRLIFSLRGHFPDVLDAEFSPDGHWVVTAGPATAGIWDALTGKRLPFLRGHTAQLVFASFDASGTRIYTASRDGTIRTYLCGVCGSGRALLALGRARLEEIGLRTTAAQKT